jgi:hypothetical protein
MYSKKNTFNLFSNISSASMTSSGDAILISTNNFASGYFTPLSLVRLKERRPFLIFESLTVQKANGVLGASSLD